MGRKKILWLCSWYPSETDPFNGDFIQRHARAAALFNDIYVIHVTSDALDKTQQGEEQVTRSEGLTEHIIYFKKSGRRLRSIRSQFQWFFFFKNAIKRYMVENGRPDLVHVQVPMKAGIIALWLKKKYQLPYVITEHWGIYNDVEVENYSRKSRIFKFFTKKIISGTSGLISPSQYLVNDMKRYFKIKNDVVIPNTVDTSLFFYRQNKNQIFRFIHVSNMVPLKNITGIIASFKAFLEEGGEAELILVGDTEPSTRKIAEDLHIPGNRIFFKGEVSYQQVAKEMQSSDCFILFSNIENSPCVIGEALCCGIPVIASDVGGVAELVDITNSILTGAQQTSALLKAMHSMVRDAVKYDKKKIAESATAKFSYPVIGKSFDELYSSLTG